MQNFSCENFCLTRSNPQGNALPCVLENRDGFSKTIQSFSFFRSFRFDETISLQACVSFYSENRMITSNSKDFTRNEIKWFNHFSVPKPDIFLSESMAIFVTSVIIHLKSFVFKWKTKTFYIWCRRIPIAKARGISGTLGDNYPGEIDARQSGKGYVKKDYTDQNNPQNIKSTLVPKPN